MARTTPRRTISAALGAVVVAGSIAAVSAPAAAATTGCRVKNVTQSTWFATATGRALTRAIERAHPGDRLNVFGRCRGSFGLDKNLSLYGGTNRREPTVLDGGGVTGSVLFVPEGVTAALTRLTITGGVVTTRVGGGIQNGGDLTLNGSAVVGNRSELEGGGIYNYGELTLNHTRVARNVAGGVGGGLFNEGVAVLNHSVVTRNTASGGGGILSVNTLTLNSTIVAENVPDDCSC